MPKTFDLLTSVTVDYIPQAVMTLDSARRCCGFHGFYIFAADASDRAIVQLREQFKSAGLDWIGIFGPLDLGDKSDVFLEKFNYYNKFELSNLAKYFGVSHVLNAPDSSDVCVFVDTDTLFFDDVVPVVAAMDGYAAYVTPHLMGPSTVDEEHDIMIHGWINAGFFAFDSNHPETGQILGWLMDRISARGYQLPLVGLSADQTWMSGIPVLFRDAVMVSDYHGLNVAYWNLAERPLERSEGGGYLAAGVPLVMFHYSGFNVADRGQLTTHFDSPVIPGSALDEICQKYRNGLGRHKDVIETIDPLTVLSSTRKGMVSRIKSRERQCGATIYKTMPRPGIFSMVGSKIDAVFRRLGVTQ